MLSVLDIFVAHGLLSHCSYVVANNELYCHHNVICVFENCHFLPKVERHMKQKKQTVKLITILEKDSNTHYSCHCVQII